MTTPYATATIPHGDPPASEPSSWPWRKSPSPPDRKATPDSGDARTVSSSDSTSVDTPDDLPMLLLRHSTLQTCLHHARQLPPVPRLQPLTPTMHNYQPPAYTTFPHHHPPAIRTHPSSPHTPRLHRVHPLTSEAVSPLEMHNCTSIL